MTNQTNQTYKISVFCQNCKNEWVEERPKGVLSSGYFECPNCGCVEGVSQGSPKQPEGITNKTY